MRNSRFQGAAEGGRWRKIARAGGGAGGDVGGAGRRRDRGIIIPGTMCPGR